MSSNAHATEEAVEGERVDGPPSPTRAGPPLWNERLELCKSEPGQWFRFGPYSSSSIIRTVNSNAKAMGMSDNIEATTRKREDEDAYDIYVVYREG